MNLIYIKNKDLVNNIGKITESTISSMNNINKVVESITLQRDSISKIIKSGNIGKITENTISSMNNINKVVESITLQRDSISKIIKSGILQNENIDNTTESTINFEEIDCIAMDSSMDVKRFSDIECDIKNLKENIEYLISNLDDRTAKSSKEKIKKYLYLLFFIFILQPMQCTINNIMIENVINPYVQKILLESNNESEAVKDIKKLKHKIFFEESFLSNYRFVSVDCLNVRSNGNIKSKIIYKLKLGDCTEVIHKKKNWTYIQYRNENITVKGWVFTRYIKKLKK